MNDKEKLISFINKGKENKPVKEVHIIKDSPTEAHILLVNEDGTNVASNRFEIMNAHDLMTLIENPSNSGLIIDISEDNKKVRITNERTIYGFQGAYYPNNDNSTQAKAFCDKLQELYSGYTERILWSIGDEVDALQKVEHDGFTFYRLSLKDLIDYINYMHTTSNNPMYVSHIIYEANKFVIKYYNGVSDNSYNITRENIEAWESEYGGEYYLEFINDNPSYYV